MRKHLLIALLLILGTVSLTVGPASAGGAAGSTAAAAKTTESYGTSYSPLKGNSGHAKPKKIPDSVTDIPIEDQNWADGVLGVLELGDNSYNVGDRYVVKDFITYNRTGGPGNIPLRAGHSDNKGGGFGFRKIRDYHGMAVDLDERGIRYVAQSPFWARKPNTTTAWNGTAYAQRKLCQAGTTNCEILEEVQITLAVDERDTSDAYKFGVVTGFCVGYFPVCPSWVPTSLANAYKGG